MGTITFTEELTSPLPARVLFDGLILGGDNLIPKVLPQAFKSIETIEGDGGPGSIKKTTFAEESGFKYLKHRVDALDKENMSYNYTLIEGDILKDKIDSVSYEIKLEPSSDGGSKTTHVTKFIPKAGKEINEEEVKDGKEKAMAIYKAVGAYLLANPQSFKAQVTPARMFKALILDSHNICPKLMFSSIESVQFIEGYGDVGTIKQFNFTEAIPFRYVKHRVDALDKDKFMCKHTLVDSDVLMDKLEYVTYEVKFEEYGFDGCICKITNEFKAKEGADIKEVDIELARDRSIGMYEVVEAYLLAHPHAYT
ncbi:Bet_v_1 domain-containing protein [Cephalotus follicularis]|uniref:Bet_v_1 domain-containing protein n=1 Tax=Cephalotus follicularis TaxID=3775 RepID=A0A1Q3B889_CEPFO|nr:Bet_v_1 domain-containing protein [Cephalotus follicularis]